MFARRLHQQACAVGSDQVVVGLALPSESTINDISIDLRVQTGVVDVRVISLMAVEGWIIPVLDPDAGASYQTLWDILVPKDTDVEVIDLDVGAVDATPFYEPGEPDFTEIIDAGLRPQRIYHRNEMLTLHNALLAWHDTITPFGEDMVAGVRLNIRIRQKYRIAQPSILMFAVANPSMDDTTTTQPLQPSEDEWGQTKYIGHVLERAMLHLFGVTEAGAETPWEEATALLKKHLEPDVFEETAGRFGGSALEVVAKAMVDHSVVGRLDTQTITTGR